MRPPITTVFYETLNLSFRKALEGMGGPVGNAVNGYLEKQGIHPSEVAVRFDDVVRLLVDAFGASARVIIYNTIVEIHREYSLPTDFTYHDSLRDKLRLLKDRVVADHLYPRHLQRGDPHLGVPGPSPVVSSLRAAR